jgi:hypothetical protein
MAVVFAATQASSSSNASYTKSSNANGDYNRLKDQYQAVPAQNSKKMSYYSLTISTTCTEQVLAVSYQ